MALPQVVVHQLPIATKFRGETNIRENFLVETPSTTAELARTSASSSHSVDASGGDDCLIARFRGRKLLGKEVLLPKGWTGYVGLLPRQSTTTTSSTAIGSAKRSREEEEGEEDRVSQAAAALSVQSFDMTAQFQQYTTWEHDRMPPAQDHKNLLAWMEIASALHGEV